MSEFPRTMIEELSVPRMIIGTNWFCCFSHQSGAKDAFITQTMTPSRMADVMAAFLEHGIDAVLGLIERDKLYQGVQEAQDRTGKELIIISTPSLNIQDGPEAQAENARQLDEEARRGAKICMPHTSCTDPLVDERARVIRNMDKMCAMIRERGMIPGLSTHLPQAIVIADESKLDVATYVSIYNAAGFLMPLEIDWVNYIITRAAKPVITIKPFAAGRLHPFVGLAFSWSTIRPQDMIAVGTMTPDEAKELIELSLSLFERRRAEVQLQTTRSKAALHSQSK